MDGGCALASHIRSLFGLSKVGGVLSLFGVIHAAKLELQYRKDDFGWRCTVAYTEVGVLLLLMWLGVGFRHGLKT